MRQQSHDKSQLFYIFNSTDFLLWKTKMLDKEVCQRGVACVSPASEHPEPKGLIYLMASSKVDACLPAAEMLGLVSNLNAQYLFY